MSQTGGGPLRKLSAMEPYGVLTNRKRVIIALVHSVVFLGIALMGLPAHPKAGLLYPHHAFSAGNIAIFGVYLMVTSVLSLLTRYGQCLRERTYFALCSASAAVGLLRALFGDPVPHLGPVARVLLLSTAVAFGFAILSIHSQPASSPET
jgi:hypothetical protein